MCETRTGVVECVAAVVEQSHQPVEIAHRARLPTRGSTEGLGGSTASTGAIPRHYGASIAGAVNCDKAFAPALVSESIQMSHIGRLR